MDHKPDSAGVTSELLARAAGGDQSAWTVIVRTYGPRLFAIAQSRLHDPEAAEELTQSVFTTLAIKLSTGEYREQGRFESWLFRVAMNRVRDVARRSVRHPAVSISDSIAIPPAALMKAPPNEEVQRLRMAMDNLTPQDREVVELRHHCGLSFQRISDVLDEPMGTLLARHHRALKKLREMLERESALGLQSGMGEAQ